VRRRLPILLLLLLPFLLVAAAGALGAAEDLPFLSGRVNDYAHMIPPDVSARVEEKLKAFEQRTGDQVVVLTIDSLNGEPIDDYSVRVAQAWKLGQKGKDNGVLLLIAKQDRMMRIEVGYGLEPQLTDLETKVIREEIINPRFRAGDFGGGVEAGVDAILKALEGDLPPPEKNTAVSDQAPMGSRLVVLLIFVVVVGTFSVIALGARGCQGWFLYLFLTPFWGIFPSVIWPPAGPFFAIGWLILFPILKILASRMGFGRSWLPAGPRVGRRSGGWWGGGFGGFGGGFGGGGFGGGGGGGGFSGGGGSFGGGGSSGSW
jgi:uncharacterized protein